MQIAVDISTTDIIKGIETMDVHELEDVKNAIIKRDIYFKKFKKDKIENVVADFKAEGYSDGFLKDLENGFKKSSVYMK
ncbi:MAG: hypothetical protein GY950_26105 [bacterium]|nr:hypothetical protein [bacterium]